MRSYTTNSFASDILSFIFTRIWSVAIFFAAFCCLAISTPTHAAGSMPQIGLQPAYPDPTNPISMAYFIFKTNPGSHIQNAVRVVNTGHTAGHAALYTTDATTGETSGTVYLERTDKSQDVGKWLSVALSSLTLAPGESAIVPFDLMVPPKVRSGVHLGGIGMEITPIENSSNTLIKKGNLQIHTRILTIVAVEIILPGKPIEALSATGIEAGGANDYQTLQLALHNTGNQMLKPAGTLEVMDAHGVHLQTLPIKMDTFLPMNSISYPVYLKKALGDGSYQVILTLAYGNHHRLRYSTIVTITPQQVQQAFPPRTLQPPVMSSSLPLWVYLVGGSIGVGVLFLVIVQCRHLVLAARAKKKVKQESRKKDDDVTLS